MVELLRRVKWKVLPILVVFLVTVGVLLGIYRAKDNRIAERLHQDEIFESARKSNSKKLLRTNSRLGEDSNTYDRWVVVATDGDEPLACALVDASVDSGWKPILIGNATCCQKSPCVSLDEAKLQAATYEIVQYLRPDSHLFRRNIAYLHAIQHGARHIFDAYHSNYRKANVSAHSLKKEMQRHLHNLTLAVSIGLVAERPYLKRVSNPYAHFGRPDMWAVGFKKTVTRDSNNFMYHICEVRPPSIEKFLEVDDGFFDYAAPPLTIPGTTLAPFLSRNVLYSAEAFWGLPFLPGNASYSDHLLSHHPHLARSLWNQALLGDIAGSVKLSLSTLPTLTNFERTHFKDKERFEWEMDNYASFLLKWSCSTRSILKCSNDLAEDMIHRGFIAQSDVSFFQAWNNDLRKLRYLEPPIITRRRGALNPCIGADGLFGVAFHPALAPKGLHEDNIWRKNVTLERVKAEEHEYDFQKTKYLEHSQKKINESAGVEYKFEISEKHAEDSRYGKSLEFSGDMRKEGHELDLSLVRETTDSICPGYSSFISSDSQGCANILLVIAMTNPHYDVIPLLEVVYRQHFKNVLFCGPPHESLEIYKKKFQNQEGRTFSFLPSHTKYTYECMMGALEMGYRVDGYMLATDETLINHMQIKNLNISRIWYGGDHVTKVTGKEWRGLDPGAQKLPRSIEGLHRVLAFLKKTVLGDGKTELLTEYNQRQRRDVGNNSEVLDEFDRAGNPTLEEEASLAFLSSDQNINVEDVVKVDKNEYMGVEVEITATEDQNLTTFDSGAYAVEEQKDEIKIAHSARAEPLIASIDSHPLVEQLTFGVPDPQSKTDIIEVKDVDAVETLAGDSPAPRIPEDNVDYFVPPELANKSQPEEVGRVPDVNIPMVELPDLDVLVPPSLLTNTSGDILFSEEKIVTSVETTAKDHEAEAEDPELTEEEETKNRAELLRELLVASRNDGIEEVAEPAFLPATMPVENTTTAVNLQVTSTETSVTNSTEFSKELEMLLHNASEIFDKFEEDWAIKPVNDTAATSAVVEEVPVEVEEEDVKLEHNWHHVVPVVSTTTKPVDEPVSPVTAVENNVTAIHIENTQNVTEVDDQAHDGSQPDVVADVINLQEAAKPTEEEERDSRIDALLEEITKLYSMVQANIQVHLPNSKSGNGPLGFVYGDQSSYRLDPQEFHHFHCDKGTNIEFCKVAADFLSSLSQNIGKDFKLFYDKVPLFYIPNRHVLKFYLLSNLMLQNGITDEIAIPMMLRGLGSQDKWVKLERVNFSYKTVTDPKFAAQPAEGAYLYPVDFHATYSDWRYQKVFCLKFLNHVLNS